MLKLRLRSIPISIPVVNSKLKSIHDSAINIPVTHNLYAKYHQDFV